jgi:hypothetical protein
MDTAVRGETAKVTTPNGVTVGDVVIYNGGFGERPYTVTAIEQNGLRLRLVDSLGNAFPIAPVYSVCRLAHPRPAAATAPTPAPLAVARPRASRVVTTCTRRPAAVIKPAAPERSATVKDLPERCREYRTWTTRTGRQQRTLTSFTTPDGTWKVDKHDHGRGVWIITHETGHEVPQWFGTADRALAAIADGYAASTLPQPATT